MFYRVREWAADHGYGQYPRELYLRVSVDRPAGMPRSAQILAASFGIFICTVAMAALGIALAAIAYLAWLFFFG